MRGDDRRPYASHVGRALAGDRVSDDRTVRDVLRERIRKLVPVKKRDAPAFINY